MPRPSFERARATHINRYTMDHVPPWASRPADGGGFYAPQYRTDREWYENSTFPGELGHVNGPLHCYSTGQSWPLGKWLEAPYQKGQ